MNTPDFPKAFRLEMALQRLLGQRQRHYRSDEGQLSLAVSQAPDDLDLALLVDWHGIPARLLCRRQRLAQWLSPQLQEADLASLPATLQLSLVQREAKKVPGLLCKGIAPLDEPAPAPYLQLTLHSAGEQLPCWVDGDTQRLLEHLPARPLHERLKLPLQLSLQWRPLQLDLATLRTLVAGDVLLLAPGATGAPHLQGMLAGRPWADLLLDDNQLEITHMHDTTYEHTDDANDDAELGSLEQLPVQICFEVGRQTLDLHTLSTLQPGSLIDLDSPLDAQVRILANQRQIGSGLLVQIEDRLGVRVTRLLQDGPA
ncbi:type III secretion system cytoplasmic ring protein SctQ [Pseudomonas sp. MWU13-3659]|uniref:type III secretion system cytoplasmic ring protein SctQ n=1 Tax=Pseudomonas sp. MWU13-3659 TaxID=2986964 RepID=UPI002075A8BD|nr:type III secretion system cytoplasmic ring protein SctQ [Pseudomonas sp. MWU13-3659]